MDPAAGSQGDRPPQGFAIQRQLQAASLALRPPDCPEKKLTEHVLHLCWLNRMTQDPAPGTVVRHALSLEVEESTQFMGAQFGPVCHRTTTILTSQFRQHPDHEQTRQGVLPTTSVSMIRNGLQTGVQRLQIKHQSFLRKRELTQNCCIVHRRTFHEEMALFHPSILMRGPFYSRSCNSPGEAPFSREFSCQNAPHFSQESYCSPFWSHARGDAQRWHHCASRG